MSSFNPNLLFFHLLFVSIFYSSFFCFENKEDQTSTSTLLLVHSIFRHGDRNPASAFKTDLYNQESTWKGGFGELTRLGIKQQYKLGQFIKDRYKGFLSEAYEAKEIHVRSTAYNRTINSALANLAGMYPPVNDQIWNPDLLWQPIPVHSRPKESDFVLWMDKSCPTVTDLYKKRVFTSENYLKIERENADFFEFLRNKTGRDEKVTLLDFWGIYDPLYCETVHNDTHKRPDWATDDVFSKIVQLYRLSTSFYYNIPEIKRLRGALMFHEIASRLMEKVANNSLYINDLKYYGYSIHDTTQVALLENLGAYDGSVPVYDQLLLIELHEINDSHIVKMYKRNDTLSNGLISVEIPECGTPCQAKKFYELSLANKPEDWEEECGLTSGSIIGSNKLEAAVGILSALCILFFVAFAVLLAFYMKLRRSNWASLGDLN